MDVALWQLDGTIAKLSAETGITAAVDVARPSAGLKWQIAAATIPLQLLGVELGAAEPVSSTDVDAFVRGRDLVATYAERPPRHVRAQIYWRSLTAAEVAPECASDIVAAFELILSVNTSVLDEDPQSTVRSQVPAAAAVSSFDTLPGCFLVRPEGSHLSYLEMVHPVDHDRSEVRRVDDLSQITHSLFARRLEKGVILRARVRGAVIARERDEATAAAAFQCFSAAEAPLTV